MRRRISTLLSAMLSANALTSCKARMEMEQAVSCPVTFVCAAAAKDDEQEKKDGCAVKSLSVFVFNVDGSLNSSGESDCGQLNMEILCGEHLDIFAVANENEGLISEVSCIDDIMDMKDSGLVDGFSDLPMTARLSDVRISKETGAVDLKLVKKYVKISLSTVRNDLPHGMGIKITGMFLSNVMAEPWLFGQICDDVWINRRGRDIVEKPWLSAAGLSVDIPNGETRDFGQVFFCGANHNTVDSRDETWCPRYTRLVVTGEVEGNTYYYPVSLNEYSYGHVLRENCHYSIEELTIMRIGSTDPEEYTVPDAMEISVGINNWEESSANVELVN